MGKLGSTLCLANGNCHSMPLHFAWLNPYLLNVQHGFIRDFLSISLSLSLFVLFCFLVEKGVPHNTLQLIQLYWVLSSVCNYWVRDIFYFRVIFTGTVVVIPDISALSSPYRREGPQNRSAASGYEGVCGLKSIGVRDLLYRLAFIANSVQVL